MTDWNEAEARDLLIQGAFERMDRRSMCEACERGDHSNCGMQTWCQCEDTRDGDPSAYDPTLWCNGCGARVQEDCICGPIADNE